MSKKSWAPGRVVVYCIVPRDLAARLHEPLRRHFIADPAVEVVVEQRWRDRRKPADRREDVQEPAGAERRYIRSRSGRRVADRRATTISVEIPGLPRKAREFEDRLVFVERLEPTTQSDEDVDTARLVTQIQGGNGDLFAELYRRYFDRVYAYLQIALKDHQLAEDTTQEVFVKVFDALPRYEPRGKPFRAWLFTIVRNEGVSVLRARGRTSVEDPVELTRRQDRAEPAVSPELVLGWIEDRELLMFIERLPSSQRQVLILRYMLDLSTDEIAAILGRSGVDVRTQQHRALRFLEQRLAALGRAPTKRQHSGWQRRAGQARVLRNRRFALLPR